MAYTWNPLWHDVEDTSNAAYVASIRRMIVASINWMDEHPDQNPQWREPDRRKLARNAGIPDAVPLDKIAFTGNWEDFFIATDPACESWFKAISEACEAVGGKHNAASAWMFGKAVACGILFRKEGWDGFNRFMLESRDGPGH